MYTKVSGNKVVVTESFGENHANIAIQSPLFLNWKNRLDPRFKVAWIKIDVVDFRGEKKPDNVLFIRLRAQTSLSKHPQIVELRGGTAVMLVNLIRDDDGAIFTILVQQARFPIGDFQYLEVAAGMIDGGNFESAAIREIGEELGTDMFEKSALVDITDPTAELGKIGTRNVPLSPGLIDETCRFYCAEKRVSRSVIEEMKGRHTGIPGEGESITLSVVPLNDLPKMTIDAKSLLAYFLYRTYKEKLAREMRPSGWKS